MRGTEVLMTFFSRNFLFLGSISYHMISCSEIIWSHHGSVVVVFFLLYQSTIIKSEATGTQWSSLVCSDWPVRVEISIQRCLYGIHWRCLQLKWPTYCCLYMYNLQKPCSLHFPITPTTRTPELERVKLWLLHLMIDMKSILTLM